MGAGVERVGAALMGREACRDQPMKRGEEGCRAVDHRGVDDLPLPGALHLENAADDSQSEIERAGGKVAEQVQRRHRRLAAASKGVQRADQGNVIYVVTRRLGQRARLTPAGDPAVDQPRVARETVLGAKAQPLGHPRTEPLDQRVGAFDQAQRQRLCLRAL